MASSSARTLDEEPQVVSINVPSSFLTITPAAALLGLVIGMRRGGRKARLQFLAENAHRLPDTYQGWYFYTKTRNYKVLFKATTTGFKYAAGLGGASLAYCFLEEYIGWARERYTGNVVTRLEGPRKRYTWRQGGPEIWDGVLAGVTMGLTAGTVFRLPRQAFVRCVGLGTVLGGLESSLQIGRDRVGAKLYAEHQAKLVAEAKEAESQEATDPGHPVVNRPVEPSPPLQSEPVMTNALPVVWEEEQSRSLWSRMTGWVSGK